jgi:replicative DNA helicase
VAVAEVSDELPSDLEAEQALIGILLYQPGELLALQVELLPGHFHEPLHGRILQAIRECLADGMTPDPTLLAEEFRGDTAFKEAGGPRYLADLVDRAPPVDRLTDYARHIVEFYARRALVGLANDLARLARSGGKAGRMIEQAEAELMKVKLASPEPIHFVTGREAARATLAEIENEIVIGRPKGAQTGLACFDRRLGGLKPAALVTIGGRPAMGKTALARAALYGAAQENPDRLFAMFSPEMSAREISERALSSTTYGEIAQIKTDALSRSRVNPTDLISLHELAERIPENLIIDDRASLSVGDVERAVWTLKARGKLVAIAVDYLQLMRRPASNGRNDAAVIGEMTQGLKRLAKSAKICVVLVSQLSRGVDSRDDKRPTLSDLRESGSIEQDSDVVLFPYREAYYHDRAEPAAGTQAYLDWEIKAQDLRTRMEVIIGKQRQGATGMELQEYEPGLDHIQNWRG